MLRQTRRDNIKKNSAREPPNTGTKTIYKLRLWNDNIINLNMLRKTS